MKIYIDGEKLMESFYDTPESARSWSRAWWLINHAKLADVRENVRGEWKLRENQNLPMWHWYTCSNCGAVIGTPTRYCSECGADMRGGQNGKNN